MKMKPGLFAWLSTAALMLIFCPNPSHAFDVSGTVHYNGMNAGRIYVSALTDNGVLGTSISGPGAFTIRGVSNGTFTLKAFMDVRNSDARHASDPYGSVTVAVSGSNRDGVDITLSDAFMTPVPIAPVNVTVLPGDGVASIYWESPEDVNGALLSDSYNLYWSTAPDVLGTYQTSGGKIQGIPASNDIDTFFHTGLTNGSTLYYAMTGMVGASESSPSVPDPPSVVIGPRVGGHAVSGTVTFSGFNPAGKQLITAVINQEGDAFFNTAQSPASPSQFAVSGVPDGVYRVYAFFDMNENGFIDTGDIRGRGYMVPLIAVSGADVDTGGIEITPLNAEVTATTEHWKYNNSEGYNIGFSAHGYGKRPVNVTLVSGPSVTAPVDLGLNDSGGFSVRHALATPSAVNDAYSFDVVYDDDTPATLIASVTGVLNDFPTPLSPVGSIAFSESPTFTWSAPASPPSGAHAYDLWLGYSPYGWTTSLWNVSDLPGIQLSAVYNFDGTALWAVLREVTGYYGTPYTWSISLKDRYGNTAQEKVNFSFTGSISGRVTDVSGSGIAGVPALIFDSTNSSTPVASVMSDANGNYTAAGLISGAYKILLGGNSLYKPQWYSNKNDFTGADTVSVVAGSTTADIDAQMILGGIISGRVTNTANAGLSRISVQVYGSTGSQPIVSAVSDTNGNYTVGGLETGSYKVQFQGGNSGYLSAWYDGAADPSTALPVPVTISQTTANINAVLIKSGGITGRVTNGTGAAIAGIWVTAYDSLSSYNQLGGTTTDASGNYTISGLAPGSYKVRFSGNGLTYAGQWYSGASDFGSATIVPVIIDQTTSNIDAVLTTPGSIMGRVTDSGGAGISGVNVSVVAGDGYSYAGWSTTGSDGSYTVGGLSTGSYKLQFQGGNSGYISEWYDNKPDSSVATSISVTATQATSNIDAVLTEGGSISGRLTNASGEGIAGIYINVYAGDTNYGVGWTITDADGNYLMKGLATGSYKLQFQGGNSGYFSEWYNHKPDSGTADTVSVILSQTTSNIDAVLTEGGKISGRVTNASGTGIGSVYISVYDSSNSNNTVGWGSTDTNGNYTVRGLATGSYKIKFDGSNAGYIPEWYNNAADFGSATAVSVAVSNTTSGIDAQLMLSGSISGRIKNSSGAGVANVSVRVYDSTTNTVVGWGYTGAFGVYTVRGLQTGTYKIEFDGSSTDYLSQWYDNKSDSAGADPVSVTAPNTTYVKDTILVKGGSITGRVTNSSGSGIPNIQVLVYDSSTNMQVGSVYSDQYGYYNAGRLTTGSYKLQCNGNNSYNDYLAAWYNGAVDFASATPVAVTISRATTDVNVVLATYGKIIGTVKNESGAGLASVIVSVYSSASNTQAIRTAYTDANGNYTVGRLAAGNYKIQFASTFYHAYLNQWYNNKADFASADAVAMNVSDTISINAVLKSYGKISGKVTNALGAGIPGGAINIYDAVTSQYAGYTYGDANGNYTIDGVAPGSYKVQFSPGTNEYIGQWYSNKPDLASADTVFVGASQTITGIDAVLTMNGRITGRVTNASGAGIQYVMVQVINVANAQYSGYAYTDANGSYALTGLTTGSYKVQFSPSGNEYAGQWYNNKSDMSGANPVSVTMSQTTANIDAVLTAYGKITGRVTNASGVGISGVMIRIYGANDSTSFYGYADTDANGYYSAGGLTTGSYKIQFDGYNTEYQNEWYHDKTDFASADPIPVTMSQTTSNIDAVLTAYGKITGRVTNSSGAGVPGVSVSAYQSVNISVSSGYTDANGYYTVGRLASGSYKVLFTNTAYGTNYADQWYSGKYDFTSADPVSVTLAQTTAGIDAVLQEGGKITGRVTNALGAGINNVWIGVVDANDDTRSLGGTWTDSNGNYTFMKLPTGTYKVQFISYDWNYLGQWYNNKPDFAGADLVSVIMSQTTSNINVVLALYGKIVGRMTNASGAGIPGSVSVYHAENSQFVGYAIADTDGNYTVTRLTTGGYKVQFSPYNGEYLGQWYNNKFDMASADVVSVTTSSTTNGIDAVLGPAVTFVITASAGTGGVIWPSGTMLIWSGQSRTFTVSPDAGYHISSVAGTCGGNLAGSTFTTNAITADCTVTANFAVNAYTVSPSAGSHGTISPSTPQTVNYHGITFFTITPDAGYTASVGGTCGGTSLGDIYTTNPITADCTVAVTFPLTDSVPDAFSFIDRTNVPLSSLVVSNTITVSGINVSSSVSIAGGEYEINSSGNWTSSAGSVSNGDMVRVRHLSSANYSTRTDTVLTIGGMSDTFSSTSVTQGGIAQFTVTPAVGPNGVITPPTPQLLSAGSTMSFTITPNTGYHVIAVSGCGGTLSGSTYTTGPITADCTVSAIFATSTYTVTPKVVGEGVISPATVLSANQSSILSYIVTPNPGYHIASVTGCDGTLSGSTYTTGPITADCMITATFISPDCDLDGDGVASVNDALRALRIAVGLMSATSADLLHGDVAPLVGGLPSPNGIIDIGDVVVILRRAVGLVNW